MYYNIILFSLIKFSRAFKKLYSSYQQNRDLISVGAYAEGSNPEVDEAIRLHSSQQQFLRQDRQEAVNWNLSLEQLAGIWLNAQTPDVTEPIETPLVPNF